MAALKLYPVGIQTFEDIINRNLLYVDKTEYIYRMTHGGGKYFFWFTTGTRKRIRDASVYSQKKYRPSFYS